MKIESATAEQMSVILAKRYFVIPRFQRPYSWDAENVEEFLSDALRPGEHGLFIGPIVVFKKSEQQYGVVDGQQRFTTLTIALCCLRDKLADRGFEELANGIHQNFVERPDYSAKNQYVLQTETSYPFLQQNVQGRDREEDAETSSSEDHNIELAARLIRKRIDDAVPAALSPQKAKAALVGIRDQLLALTAIFVVLEREDDAYVVFETLNARGKDLEAADLTKSLLLRLQKQKNVNVDRPKERWNSMVQSLGKFDINASTFLLHFWLSREEYTSKAKLYSRIAKNLTQANASKYLGMLEDDSRVYSWIFSPSARKWNMSEKDVEEALNALLIFGVSQPAPLILAVLRAYEKSTLQLKDLKRALQALEAFHFMTTAMLGMSSSGGMSKMYATTAKAVHQAPDRPANKKLVDELIGKLRVRLPEQSEFINAFEEIRFLEGQTSHRRLVRYILGRLERAEYPSLRIAWHEMSIEHLLPQNPATGSPIDAAGKIGNLLLVDQKFNSEALGNLGLVDKKKLLAKGGTKLRKSIQDAAMWTAAEIDAHTTELALKAYNEIWKF